MGREAGKKPSACRGCHYGKHQPCAGWCTRKILEEMRLLKEKRK